MSASTDPGGSPPHAQLIQMGTAYWGSQMLLVAAQLGIADRLATGARASDGLPLSTTAQQRAPDLGGR